MALVRRVPRGPGARHRARSTSRSTWSPTRSRRRSPSARRSSSSRRRRRRCPRCCSARCWPRPTCRAGMFSVLPLPNERGRRAGRRPAAAGRVVHRLRARSARRSAAVPHKHVTLELGGNAAAVVCADWASDADLDWAAPADRHLRQLPGRAVLHRGAAGIVHERLLRRFVPRLVAAVRGAADRRPGRRGDRGRAADHDEAAASGSRRGSTRPSRPGRPSLTGGRRDGAELRPDRADRRAGRREGAAPRRSSGRCWWSRRSTPTRPRSPPSTTPRTGCRRACSPTTCRRVRRRTATLEVGGVIVGDVPTFRADQMPYGGVKGTGVGREGAAQRDGRLHRAARAWC